MTLQPLMPIENFELWLKQSQRKLKIFVSELKKSSHNYCRMRRFEYSNFLINEYLLVKIAMKTFKKDGFDMFIYFCSIPSDIKIITLFDEFILEIKVFLR